MTSPSTLGSSVSPSLPIRYSEQAPRKEKLSMKNNNGNTNPNNIKNAKICTLSCKNIWTDWDEI